ncbi:neuroglian isoform X2 [Fopius arisanus]|uniref:Neuroglian isoform X2 n=1 Tax=Fopius arisanus TaxID=64838 RepID=A0A9R1TEK6_9HYME|nr:PREDICTED: neuroglian isoform X2 [Fopius arisanus]
MTMRCSLFIVVASALYASASIQSPPRISKQPPTDELLFQVAQANQNENDRPFLIECEAEGEPAPTYRWIKNGEEFDIQQHEDRITQQPGRGTLVISRPRDEDLGQYQCFAENQWGIATSNSVFARKAELNSFKDEDPMTLTAQEGSPFKLTCKPPEGWPKPNVYWLIQDAAGIIKSINNSRMTLDPEGNLWFSNVTRDDASDDFYYACSISSVYRKEYKVGNRFLLNVIPNGPLAILKKHPPVAQYLSKSSEVALRGKKVELFCIFGGTPLPETVWRQNGSRIKPNDRVTHGNYGKSLIIKHVDFHDQGKYTCDVSNGVGKKASHSIDLTVVAVPFFTVQPEIQTAAEDETVNFQCEASGVPTPKIEWIHNGKPISQAPYNPRRRVAGTRIVIEGVTKKDTGNYGCNATNSLGYVYKDVYVNVLALEPEITQPPMNEATVDGTTVTMTCRVFGAPKPTITWRKGSQEVGEGKFRILNTGDLEIINVDFRDAGTYTCHAANKFGKVDASANLVVKEHTRITQKPEDYEVAAGDTATFRCNAVADSSLTLQIDWLKDDEVIDTENEPRLVVTNDFSLSISKTTESDSGIYSCLAKTEIDEQKAQATLVVQDVPDAPVLTSNECYERHARLSWQPRKDNQAPILRYTLQYNTSFTPDAWETVWENISAIDRTSTIPMSPWANYTFRIIAWNKIGASIPSAHSTVCRTQPDFPHKNPSNVMGNGTTPQNLVVSWTVMPQVEHHAPGFMYKVFYRRDIPGEEWQRVDVWNWKVNRFEVDNQPTYQRYQIKVVAQNEMGESRVVPEIVIGYSGEDQPTTAPGNFTVEEVKSSTTAVLSWSRVPLESVKGELKGYKVQTWTERDGEDGMREITLEGATGTRAIIDKFVPFSKNFVRMFVFNGRFNGPPSETLSFDTPEGVPGTILSLDAYPMGSSAMMLRWTKPAEPNGRLTGYRIYYETINGTEVGALVERQPRVLQPDADSAKIAGLNHDTKYRIHVRATTNAGEGVDFYVEESTRESKKPDVPTFRWETIPKENGLANVKVVWLPDRAGYPGSSFFVNYKLQNQAVEDRTEPQLLSNEIEIKGLRSGETYEMNVVAVDGKYMTPSKWQLVETSSEGPIIQPKENVATAGWFIGMMLAIAFLLMVLIIVCVIKRNRGGKYAVHERELAAGRGDYPDEGGFHEYSQPLDTKSAGGRTSVASSSHQDGKHPESDTDSMAEYGEGDTEGMNEDGSFIGQYGRQKKPEPNSQAFATLV